MADRRIAEAFPPGEFIKEELEARNWSQGELAEIIGRQPSVISDLIIGKRAITPEIAKALGDAFGTSAQYWMNLESAYQLWRVRDHDSTISRRAKLYRMAPIKEMVKRKWLEQSENIDVLEDRVKKFFEIEKLEDTIEFRHAARKSTQELSAAQMAWLFRARQLSFAVQAGKFTEQSFVECLNKLKQLLLSRDSLRNVARIMADGGIRFIVVEHLPHTKIDGVTFWVDNSPVVVLSLRYDRIDYAWFTIAHELGHVHRRDGLKYEMRLDSNITGDEQEISEETVEAEKYANRFATEFLVGEENLNNFILRNSPLYGKQQVIGFAKRMNVHPGIVVGQLHFKRELPWNSYRQMLDKVRHVVTDSALTDGWGQSPPILKHKEELNVAG